MYAILSIIKSKRLKVGGARIESQEKHVVSVIHSVKANFLLITVQQLTRECKC